ncbi:WecB/TagA/CpsF family glycosyltransferase [Labrenzia sp. PHM005]|uniref:WecB/TagA/CpsF family glycosyltransferase n=1 Tax=Labrenzia sp. PHM005 TaxID=2590016 RepID=UPI00113FF4EA|nr:WecB/TagA/CpsF family glycosyltransferase [Labrenzia sp. PHM005]QDG74822.1 WecB/TagA/CpsF family glycosyltransferase [Labrenzia sp. PHM005]
MTISTDQSPKDPLPSARQSSFSQCQFMGLEFDIGEQAEWLPLILNMKPQTFEFFVTPNVYHVILLERDMQVVSAYDDARWKVCDSKILSRLAHSQNLDLKVYPGADIVQDLLADPKAQDLRFAIIGPDLSQIDTLRTRYPDVDIQHIPSGIMDRRTPEWEKVLTAAEACHADIFLICLSFPKQEYFAQDLKRRGNASGVGLCVGASIDFLTGRQKRAPEWIRACGMEWAFRLVTNPKRMWRRYLWDGPKIIWMFLKWRHQS